jgi:hypothetical protein
MTEQDIYRYFMLAVFAILVGFAKVVTARRWPGSRWKQFLGNLAIVVIGFALLLVGAGVGDAIVKALH